MNHLLSATALVATLAFSPAIANANNYGNAHERCKRAEDNRQILGGFAGAVLGGVLGSQIAGSGARTEGSVIAGTIGALAGAGIADKSIDCDPVYPDQQAYSSGTTYSSSPSPTYSSGTSYSGGSRSYGGTQTYEDRVTVSNHPVYSDPNYGAGAISQGTTYSVGTTSYPSSGSNSQFVSNTYTAPTTTYAAPVTTYTPPATTYYAPPETTYVSQPTRAYSPSYSSYSHDPQFRTVRTTSAYGGSSRRARRHNNHYHGRYSCDMRH